MNTSTAIMLPPVAPPSAPFGLRLRPLALDQVLEMLEHGHGVDRALDAAIYEALGWDIHRGGPSRRRMAWRVKSPVAMGWEIMPSPTADEHAAAGLVPYRWSYSAGVVEGQPRAWCRENRPRPGREKRFAECNRLSVPRALTAAALFAHRQIVMGG